MRRKSDHHPKCTRVPPTGAAFGPGRGNPTGFSRPGAAAEAAEGEQDDERDEGPDVVRVQVMVLQWSFFQTHQFLIFCCYVWVKFIIWVWSPEVL